MSKTLKLVLKRKWWDMIASGEKKVEYRELTEYWKSRLVTYPNWTAMAFFKEFDAVTFYLGYAKDRPSMTFKVKDIRIGIGKPEWGAEQGKSYFVIELGGRI